jgi:putative nucleotidyltransferase with HDIG domain
MPERIIDPTIPEKIESAVRRLTEISILPSVAASCISRFTAGQLSSSSVADIVESDPALVVLVFAALRRESIVVDSRKLSIRRALSKLPTAVLRESLLSAKVLDISSHIAEAEEVLPRKELTRHSLAVACCAKTIAEITLGTFDPDEVYLAGLLHDIGKFALAELMPKSFARIVEQAKSQKCSANQIERKHLGIDHTILGKRLVQRWSLGQNVSLGIWLHHTDAASISQGIPQAEIVQIVQLADCIVRKCGIGDSGSYDSTETIAQYAQSLSIDIDKIDQISAALGEQISRKCEALGLDIPDPTKSLSDAIGSVAVQLARENTKLTSENQNLQSSSGHVKFVSEFFKSVEPQAEAIEVAQSLAVCWQKFYQTGKVCLYPVSGDGRALLEVVVVENLAQSSIVSVEVPTSSSLVPGQFADGFAMIDAAGHIDWLFDQLDTEFDPSQTKLIPLLSGDRVLGILAFELRYPGDMELFRETFEAAASIAALILDMAVNFSHQQHFAEHFAGLLSENKPLAPPQDQHEIEQRIPEPKEILEQSLDALAEMAGGAAHELNNPLSVISGRAQLLANAETDEKKKGILRQIQQNASELSGIINDLMIFANPPAAKPTVTPIKQILDESVQFAGQKAAVDHINVQFKIADGLDTVFVDSAQIVPAIANVICNCLESYDDNLGPIKITAKSVGDFVEFQLSDLGRGMDEQKVAKAAQPFFSSQPAGRKRGMGLAHAQRFIELNKGTLKIKSQPETGTIVTILLPSK